MSWADVAMGEAHLGDARLSRRLVRLLDRLGVQPSASMCSGAREIKAAYLLLAHDLLRLGLLRRHHCLAGHALVPCLQDTIELDFSAQDIDGVGRLSYPAQRGMRLHATYAVTPQRVPQGVLNAWKWARLVKPTDAAQPAVLESTRWVGGDDPIAELAGQLPDMRLVCVGNRVSDMLALMVKARDSSHAADYLVSCQHNRVVGPQAKLWGQVMAQVPLGCIGFEMPVRCARSCARSTCRCRIGVADISK